MKQLIYRLIYNQSINGLLRKINKLLYPFLPKSLRIPPSGVLKLKTAEGIDWNLAVNQTNYLAQMIYWDWNMDYTRYEYTEIFSKLIKKINVFYDIGANIGYYVALAGVENKSIKIVAFEPASGPLFYLKKNIEVNTLSNVKVESLALSHQKGSIDFYEIKNNKYKYLKHNLGGEGNTGTKTQGRNYVLNKVPTNTFDNYVQENREKNIDLVKIDTEGTEHFILQEADFILRTMKPIVICETLFNTTESDLNNIFSQYGYEFFNHSSRGLEKKQSIERVKDDGIRNCFFVHPSKYHLIEEFVHK